MYVSIVLFQCDIRTLFTITITVEICIAPLKKWTVALNNVNMAVKHRNYELMKDNATVIRYTFQ